ncbi:hypothetical protein [Novosphingobium huizhouense]|uniref:hypothetical protein n=1 Tax=Novosphingobium huizhouense TaxID=2866625 RepID=UPI001CD910CB|nr:hypothetical protein [Novosphingobium huizhouense]
MNKLNMIAVAGGALALCLAGTAQAAATRSGDAVPAVAKKAPKRSVAALRGKRSNEFELSAGVIAAAGVTTLAIAAVALSDNGDSDG